ncbi:MAG TPA: hypothetical protein VE623_20920 [Acidimicrobiales bacterium]|nr:hypothetical protein [Acidimicrobiales bacterium]
MTAIDKPEMPPTSPDDRAREIEEQMSDDERFSLIISVIGAILGYPRDPASRRASR